MTDCNPAIKSRPSAALLLAAALSVALSVGVRLGVADPTDKPADKADATDQSQSLTQLSPDIVFKDKGVSRVGNRLVVPAEAEMHAAATELRAAKAKQKTEDMARKMCDTEIAAAKKALADSELKYKRFNEALATAGDPMKQNQYIGRINASVAAQKAAQQTLEDQAEKKKTLTSAHETYIDLVIADAEKAEKDAHAYDELSKDQELFAAIDRNNSSPKAVKVRLGPTADFLADIAFIRKCKEEVSMEVVTISSEKGVPEVDANLNGTLRIPMVWDSGASLVTITTETADKIGLHPTEKDPLIKAKLADGRLIEGHMMTIKTIQVGIFTVNDVDCMVMPPDIKDKDTEPLLGDSFQSHFMSKLDQAAGQLRLTPLDAPAKKLVPTRPQPIARPAADPAGGN